MSSSMETVKSEDNDAIRNKENFKTDRLVAKTQSRQRRRATLTAKELRPLSLADSDIDSNENKQKQPQQQQHKQKQQRRRSTSLLNGLDPSNIILGEWSANSSAAGRAPSPTSPAESQIQRANALSAELDRIFDKSAAPSLRRSLRRKSFSISLSATTNSSSASNASTTGKSYATSSAGQESSSAAAVQAAELLDPALVQLYKQQGTYKPPQPTGLGTIPEVSANNRALPSTSRRRFIDFDSPARQSQKDRSRGRKAFKFMAAVRPKSSRAAAASAPAPMDMDEFKAYIDGLNLMSDR